jgi:SynChlorMet cassette radical SAM/SPASM protein ScmF
MEQDQNIIQRPLSQIYFYLTADCNMRCVHCWIAPKYQSQKVSTASLPFELYCSIIKEAKPLGMASVKLTGGEPLLHPRISDILEFTKEEKVGLGMETNGTLCTAELAKQIAGSVNPFVSVSIDGVDAETHEWVRGVKGSFQDSLTGLGHLVDAGLKPQVIMTIMRKNVGQMEAMIRLAEKAGAGSVKFNVLQPTARGLKLHDAGENIPIDELVRLGNWVENELSRTTKLKLYFCHPPAFRPLGNMFGEKGNGCGVCGIKHIIGVLPDGSYALCGIGEAIPEMVFGNAAKDKLENVWRDATVIRELREGLPERLEGVCGDCLMKNICLGSCIAQNYYRSKSMWAPFWYCEEAHKMGLFPGSRLTGEQ